MTPASLASSKRRPSAGSGLLILCLLALAGGCHKRTALAAPPLVIVPVPEEPAPAPPAPAETKSEPAPAPPTVTETKPAKATRKAAPHKSGVGATPAPAPADSSVVPAPKPPAPTMSPQLSSEDQADYQRKTDDNIKSAETNLHLAEGRQLNAAQIDLREKIQAFLSEARDAMRAADWEGASNLASKAYVLSAELANSL
jgi:hypothetical protein